MSQENGARRNRALRKSRQCSKLPLEVRATIQALVDRMCPSTGYDAAWPSVATIARLIGKAPRTVRWYLRAIKRTGIFQFEYLKPKQARQYLLEKYGFEASFDSCSRQAPTIYRVNPKHWLWDTSVKVTAAQDAELGEIVENELDLRNKSKNRSPETSAAENFDTSSVENLAVDRDRYDTLTIRKGLKKFFRRTSATKQEAFKGRSNVVGDISQDVASDITCHVADDSQVLEKQKEPAESPSFCLSNGTPPAHRSLEALQLAPVASSTGAARAAPRGGLRTTNEVDKSPSFVLLRPHPNSLTKKQEPEDKDDLEFNLENMTEDEIAEFCHDLAAEVETDDDPYDDLKDLKFRHPGLLNASGMENFLVALRQGDR